MFLTILTFLSAISISIIAAGYSIIGLATLFSGAVIPIIAMGSALEIGKLVAASWLYNNWSSSMVPKALKAYLFTAIVVLVFITSMGIFGFLSKAHLDQVKPQSGNALNISVLDKQINQQQVIVDRAEKTLNSLDKALDKYIDMEYVSRGLKEREKQKAEREVLNKTISEATAKIVELNKTKNSIELEQIKIEAEVGPLKYVAELIYGDDAKSHFDEAVRIVILILIFVFDPLAVLLLIAANISLKQIRLKKNLTKIDEKEQLEKRIERQQSKIERLKEKDRDFRKLVAEVGELKDMSEDEIKLKLNQIYDWNDKNN